MPPPVPDSRRTSLDSTASSYRSHSKKAPHDKPAKHAHDSIGSDSLGPKWKGAERDRHKLFAQGSISSTSTMASTSTVSPHPPHPHKAADKPAARKPDVVRRVQRHSLDSQKSSKPQGKNRLRLSTDSSMSSALSPLKKVSTKPLRKGGLAGNIQDHHESLKSKETPKSGRKNSIDPMLNPVVRSYSTTTNAKTDDFVVHYNRSTHSRITVDPNHEKFYETHGYPETPSYHHTERRFSDDSKSDEDFDMVLFTFLRADLNERRRLSRAARRRRRREQEEEDEEEEEEEQKKYPSWQVYPDPPDPVAEAIIAFCKSLCCCVHHGHNQGQNKVADAALADASARRKSTRKSSQRDRKVPNESEATTTDAG